MARDDNFPQGNPEGHQAGPEPAQQKSDEFVRQGEQEEFPPREPIIKRRRPGPKRGKEPSKVISVYGDKEVIERFKRLRAKLSSPPKPGKQPIPYAKLIKLLLDYLEEQQKKFPARELPALPDPQTEYGHPRATLRIVGKAETIDRFQWLCLKLTMPGEDHMEYLIDYYDTYEADSPGNATNPSS